MNKYILTILIIVILPLSIFSQQKTTSLDLNSKSKELNVNPEVLQRIINNTNKMDLINNDDPQPEAMNRSFITGPPGISFGEAIASAGDVNGDGYNDILIAAPDYNAHTGRVYIYFGGSTISNTPNVIFTGEAVNNYFGLSVSSAGDVNGDGYADIIIGAYNNASGTGKAYIYFGGTSMNNVADVILAGENTNNYFGGSVSQAGDVNGDGYADVIVGATGYTSFTGRAYIYYGGTNMNNIADVIMTGSAVNEYFGTVSNAGDVNGDGYADVIVGGQGYLNSTGRAYVFYGGSSMNNIPDVLMTGESINNLFGLTISSAGDFNGDGFSDILIGAQGYNNSTGRAYLYFGGTSMDNISDLTFTGEAANNSFGYSLSLAGDVNGDGYSDIIISTPSNNSNTGKAYVFNGGSNSDAFADRVITGDAASGLFGYAVSSAGDLNNDGYADFIISSPGNNKIYIYKNSLSGIDSPSLTFKETGSTSYGRSIASVGDVNGDGYEDLLVGAPAINSGTNKAYLYFGGPNFDGTADMIFTGESSGAGFGLAVSAAGDVNGDGYNDFIIGSPFYLVATGRAYIYYGGPSLDNIADVILTGPGSPSDFGFSVSGGKDFNGDGFSDVLVGAYASNNGGKAYLYYGGSPMNNVSDLTFSGTVSADYFGQSVNLISDVNGDGFADVLIGAFGTNSSTGKAYLYFGGSTPDNTSDLTFAGQNTNDNFGINVSGAGDINGDGYNDFMIAMEGAGQTDYISIYFGGSHINNYPSMTISSLSNEHFGANLSEAGDVNGDGYDDILLSVTTIGAGKAYIYFGGNQISSNPDITMLGEYLNDSYGLGLGKGDFNGDGIPDIAIGGSGISPTGKAFLYLSTPPAIKPNLLTVKDIPNDQGGKVILKWTKSAYQQTGLVTGYDVFRSPAAQNGVFYWQFITNIAANSSNNYSYNADTYNDSVAAGVQKTFFKIVAKTNYANEYWTSNIQSGYSIDNLAPASPANLAASPTSSVINLNWDDAYAPDISYYKIYRDGVLYTTSTISQYSDNSVNSNSSYTYKVSAVDIHGNESDLSSPVTSSIAIKLSLKLFIEGAYANGFNSTNLITAGLIPLTSPYSTGETVSNSFLSSHLNITDWIKLDLRQSVSGSAVSSRSVFLLSDGSLLDTNGTSFCTFYGEAAGNYYIVVNHRNHLSVMTNSFLALTTISINYDFTTGLNKFYGSDAKGLSGGVFGMYAGDGNGDGAVDNSDKNTIWRPNNGQAGYLKADFNLDGSVDNIDKNIKWRPNNGKATNVP